MQKNKKIKGIIIIPVYNEEHNIKGVIEELKQEIEFKLLLINDGSSDKTAMVAKETNGVNIIDLPYNLGIGGAVQTGFQYACKNNYNIIIRMDGDGQHRSDQIKKILQPVLDKKADVIIGSRFLDNHSKRPIFIRRMGQKIISLMVSLIIRQRITDSTSGFRCYNKQALNLLNQYYPTDYPEPEEIIFLKKNGLRIKETAVLMKPREKGNSSLTTIKSFYYMIKVTLSIFINIFRSSIIK
jgi:glycosyltransferase involved in cell wall biosynthesis